MDFPTMEKNHQRKLLEEHLQRLTRDLDATRRAIASLPKEKEFVSYEEFLKLFKEHDIRVHVDVPAEIGVQNWWETEPHKTMWLVKHDTSIGLLDLKLKSSHAGFFRERDKDMPMKFTGLNLFSVYKTLRERKVDSIVTMNRSTVIHLMK